MINIEKLKNRGAQKKKELKKFLKRVEKNPPRGLLKTNAELTAQTWNEVDCLSCANCCKKMTPTFKKVEVKRIAEHIGMTYNDYFEKYLEIDEDNGDIVNKSTPCQHLDLSDNKCKVYDLRPADCRQFPHFQRKDFNDISYVIAENIPRCPATLIFVEKLQERLQEPAK
jgi:Fe-S-cluster containining protein